MSWRPLSDECARDGRPLASLFARRVQRNGAQVEQQRARSCGEVYARPVELVPPDEETGWAVLPVLVPAPLYSWRAVYRVQIESDVSALVRVRAYGGVGATEVDVDAEGGVTVTVRTPIYRARTEDGPAVVKSGIQIQARDVDAAGTVDAEVRPDGVVTVSGTDVTSTGSSIELPSGQRLYAGRDLLEGAWQVYPLPDVATATEFEDLPVTDPSPEIRIVSWTVDVEPASFEAGLRDIPATRGGEAARAASARELRGVTLRTFRETSRWSCAATEQQPDSLITIVPPLHGIFGTSSRLVLCDTTARTVSIDVYALVAQTGSQTTVSVQGELIPVPPSRVGVGQPVTVDPLVTGGWGMADALFLGGRIDDLFSSYAVVAEGVTDSYTEATVVLETVIQARHVAALTVLEDRRGALAPVPPVPCQSQTVADIGDPLTEVESE